MVKSRKNKIEDKLFKKTGVDESMVYAFIGKGDRSRKSRKLGICSGVSLEGSGRTCMITGVIRLREKESNMISINHPKKNVYKQT